MYNRYMLWKLVFDKCLILQKYITFFFRMLSTQKAQWIFLFEIINIFASIKNNSKLVDKIDSVAGNIKRPVTTAANF